MMPPKKILEIRKPISRVPHGTLEIGFFLR